MSGHENTSATHADTGAQLEHTVRVLKAIRNVNQLITRAKDRDTLLQGACDSLTETRGHFDHQARHQRVEDCWADQD